MLPDRQSRQAPARTGRCILLSQMREQGFSGGQVHTLAVRDLLARAGWTAEVLTPFSGKAALRGPVFALRYALRPFSRQVAIWWLREGHNFYLRRALGRALHAEPESAILYAQDPLSAQAALALRRPGLDKVVLVPQPPRRQSAAKPRGKRTIRRARSGRGARQEEIMAGVCIGSPAGELSKAQ